MDINYMEHIRVSYADCITALLPGSEFSIDGDEYSSIQWDSVNLTQPTEEEIKVKKIELENNLPMKLLRIERDMLLFETDKYGLVDYPYVSDLKKTEWLTYRQELRDITKTQTPTINLLGELSNVTWPTKPS